MKRLATIGDVELHVCDDGLFVVRGGMFMDDLLRLEHENAKDLAETIIREYNRRLHEARSARPKKRKAKGRK